MKGNWEGYIIQYFLKLTKSILMKRNKKTFECEARRTINASARESVTLFI